MFAKTMLRVVKVAFASFAFAIGLLILTTIPFEFAFDRILMDYDISRVDLTSYLFGCYFLIALPICIKYLN